MWHDCFGGVMENGGRRRRVSGGSSSSSISKSKLWDDSRRDPTTEAFSDVFGGPPRSIYSRKLMQEAFCYNQVFKPLKVGVGDSSSRRIAEKGGGGSGPQLPVFELPGRSVLPVFELPCCRDRLLHAARRPKSHADDFYDDIFRGAAHAEGCNPEPESSSKSCKFEKSRSRSASSSLSWSPKKDCSPSASKPRPPRHGRCYAFNLSCKDPFRVASRESEETSTAGEAKCCSPDESRRIDNTNAGFPKFRHLPCFQSSPTDRPVGNIRNAKTLRKPDSCSHFDDDQFCSKYSNGVNDGMAPVDYFEPKDCRFSSSSSSKEPWTIRPLVDSIPHPTPPESPNLDDQNQKPWKDLLNQLPNSISSRTKNSPRSESSHHEREKICESFMDGRHEFNVLGLYPIEYALDERENFALESKDSHLHDCPVTSDVSDIAVTEAIAWAKEKFMCGACKPESCEELGEDAAQALVFRSDLAGGDVEENAKQYRMDIQDEIVVADDGWSPRHEGSFEAHNEIVDHRTKYKQQPGLDRDRALSTRASSLMLEPEIDLLFHAPELQGAYAIDATFHESTRMGICGMLENQACCEFNAISLDSCEEDFKGTQFASDHEHNHGVAN